MSTIEDFDRTAITFLCLILAIVALVLTIFGLVATVGFLTALLLHAG